MRILLILLMLFVSGCGRGIWFRWPWTTEPPITLYPIDKSHIISVPPGAIIQWGDTIQDGKEAKAGEFLVEHWGWYISDFYMKEIKEAKINYK